MNRIGTPATRRGRDLPEVDSRAALRVTGGPSRDVLEKTDERPGTQDLVILLDTPFTIEFAAGDAAVAARVGERGELAAALEALGLTTRRPVLVVAGDAGSGAVAAAELRPLFEDVLLPCAAAHGAYVVDGGTDAGVMAMLGQARARLRSAVALVGVVVDTLARRPGQRFEHPGGAALERHHTHFVFVAGSRWGDESPWIAQVASELAAGAPSLTVLVGGGAVAWDDVAESVRAARPVIAVAGSGRTADAVAAAARGEARDERGLALAQSALLTSVELADRAALAAAIDRALSASAAP